MPAHIEELVTKGRNFPRFRKRSIRGGLCKTKFEKMEFSNGVEGALVGM